MRLSFFFKATTWSALCVCVCVCVSGYYNNIIILLKFVSS